MKNHKTLSDVLACGDCDQITDIIVRAIEDGAICGIYESYQAIVEALAAAIERDASDLEGDEMPDEAKMLKSISRKLFKIFP